VVVCVVSEKRLALDPVDCAAVDGNRDVEDNVGRLVVTLSADDMLVAVGKAKFLALNLKDSQFRTFNYSNY
jgi:hypothetical protein